MFTAITNRYLTHRATLPVKRWISVVVSYGSLALLLAAALLPPAANAAPAAQMWALWDSADEHSTRTIDHQAWQAFLDKYLRAADDGVNRVAYREVSAADRQQLQAYLANLAEVDPRTLNKDEQMAYWINLYNALTVEVVLRYPKKDSILRMGDKFFAIGPWDDKLITVAGTELTLNDIEHRVLRPIWRDHRIHFAVNCASIGCPNLSMQAYTADNLEQQLADAETAYINHPRGLSFNKKGVPTLSNIFKWYREDFAADEQALLTYLGEHYQQPERLKGYSGTVKYDYDWSLNRAN